MKEFESQVAFRQHYKDHRGEIKCPECDKILKTHRSFLSHYKNQHSDNSKRYRCSSCEGEYKTERDLERHVGTVHLKLRLECDICGKTFPEKGKLQSHVKHIHNENLHCSFCDKDYQHLDTYKKHMKRFHSENLE